MTAARGPLRPLYAQASGSPIRAMLALAGREGMVSLAGGHPDPALLPADWLRESLLEITGQLQGRSLQYGATEGLPALREASAALLRRRGLTAQAARQRHHGTGRVREVGHHIQHARAFGA